MGLLDGLMGDDTAALAMGLLGGQSPNFGQNLAQAFQYAQAAKQQRMQQEMLQQQMLAQKMAFEDQQRQRQQGEKDRGIQSNLPQSGNTTFERIQAQLQYMQQNGASPQAMKPYFDLLEKFRPKAKADQVNVRRADGSLGVANVLDDGTTHVTDLNPAEEMRNVDLGGVSQQVGKYGGMGQAFQNTVSPNSALSANVAMRGQNMTDARSREQNAIALQGQQTQVLNDPNQGPLLVDRKTGTARPVTMGGQPVPSENAAKQARGAKNVLTLLDEAEKHLPNATNSVAGRGLDYAVRGVGLSTEGDRETASLQAIEGALLSQMPRMEGPQSNLDVENYKKAAGMIGNSLLPRAIRKQAIDTIREIQTKYAGVVPATKASGGFKYLGTE